MKTIKVLGPGCARCKTTEAHLAKALRELNIEAKVEKVTDYEDIMMYDIMSTPAVVIDEQVVHSGSIPGVEDLKKMLA